MKTSTKIYVTLGLLAQLTFTHVALSQYNPDIPDLESAGIVTMAEAPGNGIHLNSFEPSWLPDTLTPVEQEIVYDVASGAEFEIDATRVTPREWAEAYYVILQKYGDNFSDTITDPEHAEFDLYTRLRNIIR